MRLTRSSVSQLASLPTPLAPTGDLCFEYHGRSRCGRLETLGEGPAGAFLLIRHPDGARKSYSLAKMTGLRTAETAARTRAGAAATAET
ncbi:MAG: hypothetical protein AAF907_08880 [Planctomycetota bacterium]